MNEPTQAETVDGAISALPFPVAMRVAMLQDINIGVPESTMTAEDVRLFAELARKLFGVK